MSRCYLETAPKKYFKLFSFFLGGNDCAAVRLRKIRKPTDANGLSPFGRHPIPSLHGIYGILPKISASIPQIP